jgi:DNA-binding NarL/FixJ family response regulator
MVVRLVTLDATTLSQLGYRLAVAECPDITLVGQAGNAAEGLALVADQRPDVVAIDLLLPGMEVARLLRADRPHLGIIMTGPRLDQPLYQCLEAGLSGYVPHTASVALLMSAVRHAAVAPTSFTAPDLAMALSRRRARSPLSPREQELFAELGTGASLAAIAGRLSLTESTVRTYLARLYEKLNVHTREDALRVGSAPPRPD